jgi:antitoxin component YwqK of YwqJK toxin-antitoxin module
MKIPMNSIQNVTTNDKSNTYYETGKLITKEDFVQKIFADDFIDWEFENDEYYGVAKSLSLEKDCVNIMKLKSLSLLEKVKQYYPNALYLLFAENKQREEISKNTDLGMFNYVLGEEPESDFFQKSLINVLSYSIKIKK